jgi:hypothetical protein
MTDIYLDMLDANLAPNALSGLTSATTLHFMTFTESIARKRYGSILDNTDATLLFLEQGGEEPEPPTPSVTLTDDEIRGIETLCSGSKELSGAMDALKASLLEFKTQGYLNKVESEKITEQEMAFIEKTVKSLGLASDFTEKTVQDFINRLTTYKQKLMKG